MRWRGCLLSVLVVSASLFALVGGVWVVGFNGLACNHCEFSQDAWRQATRTGAMARDRPSRASMVDDLVERRLLIGMTKPQVTDLLGPGDGSSWWATSCEQAGQSTLAYELPGASSDLVVVFGCDALVAKAFIAGH